MLCPKLPSPESIGALSRRLFAQRSVGAATLAGTSALWGALGGEQVVAESVSTPATGLIRAGDTILFQGDSITDAGRSRDRADQPNQQASLGTGYAWNAAAALLIDHPTANLRCFNRGISGHKVFQLAERWQADCIAIQPNVLSILIGVNDIWHALNGNYAGTVETYEADYRQLVQQTQKALPDVRLVICEPFVLRAGAVNDKWFPQFDRFREAALRVATLSKAVWVPFQAMFDRASEIAPPEHWAADGVHPTAQGGALMAHAWLRAVGAHQWE